MGTTAEKLTYLNETKTQLKDMLNLGGASLTTEPFRQYVDTLKNRYLYFMNNGTQQVWDNWEKVSGEGTILTLNNTEKAPMSLVYKGNTHQDSTTGKNIWNLGSLSGTTQAGITLTKDTDGGFLLNGTSTGVGRFKIALNTDINETITLYLKSSNNSGDIMISLRDANDAQLISMRNDNVLKVYSYNPTAPVRYIELLQLTSGVQYTNYKVYPMIVKGSYTSSTIGDYEPYTNGASPNPQYPQDIHVVSGDNTIKVVGKNLFDDSVKNGKWLNTNGSWSKSAEGSNLLKVECSSGDVFSLSATFESGGASDIILMAFFDENDNMLSRNVQATSTSPSLTSTAPTNTAHMWAGHYTSEPLTIQLERGEATTYEPYQEQNYPINLGVENLWNTSKLKDGFVPASGAYPTNNTSFPNAKYLLVYLYKGQSLTIANQTDIGQRGRIRYIDKDTNLVIDNVRATTNAYYTSNLEGADGFKNGTITARKDFIIAFMTIDITDTRCEADVTYGTTPQTISDNPIELCKIGDYQDKLFRTSGKNLFSGDYSQFDSTGGEGTTYGYFKLPDDGERYTLSVIAKKDFTATLSQYIGFTKKGGIATGGLWWLIQGNQTYTKGQKYTIHNSQQGIRLDYVSIYANNSTTLEQLMDNFYIQLEKSSEATDYEPYGNGDWYLEKKIGKVVLDGSEVWTKHGSIASWFYYDGIKNGYLDNTSSNTAKSNYYKQQPYSSVTSLANGEFAYGTSDGGTTKRLVIKNTDYNNASDFMNWLSTHNTEVYYALATLTYTKIEGTLKDQLNALAKSYTSQTNITQENNDMPFILDITALKEM